MRPLYANILISVTRLSKVFKLQSITSTMCMPKILYSKIVQDKVVSLAAQSGSHTRSDME